jgi:hypothetical protein
MAASAFVAVQLLFTAPAMAASGWIPTMDYCGQIWHDVNNGNPTHNGVDIWTSNPGSFTGNPNGFNGSSKGYPIKTAADGILRQFYQFNGVTYGLRIYHPSVNQTTFYWHMGDYAGTSYVETATLVAGGTYPAGTFLGYQGNLAANGSPVVHLHVSVVNGDVGGDAGAIDPSAFFGRDLNGEDGSACYGQQNMQYLGPHPASPHPYSDFGARWFVILNANTASSVTRAEFGDLRMNSGDFVNVYQFNTSSQTLTLLNQFTGHPSLPVLSSPGAGRVLFIQVAPNGNGINDHGFDVINYHNF